MQLSRRLSFIALLLVGCPDAPEIGDAGTSSSGASTGSEPPPVTSTDPPSPSTGVADDSGTSATSTGGTGDPQDCCATHPEAGCDDPALVDCVCKQEAFCCAFAWDADCVEKAEQCGGCGAATDTTGTTGEETDGPAPVCCAPAKQPGCAEDPVLETCVCALDPFCCDEQWDGMCTQVAQLECGLECNMGGGGDCCSANGSPGCDDPVVQDCVCLLDGYCCNNEWDGICVAEAQYACMDECGLPPANMGDCCMPQPGPGCGDMLVTECTCLADDDCCLFPWSDQCILVAVSECGIMCAGVEPLPPCCLPQMGPGCDDMLVQACVCAFDAFCCDVEWDDLCVDGAQMSCMLDCSGAAGGSSTT